MIPLFHEPGYTFRFRESRRVSRFHLEGAKLGSPVNVYRFEETTLRPGAFLGSATVGDGGWVDWPGEIFVDETGGFYVVIA
jgi:hypothetical protein